MEHDLCLAQNHAYQLACILMTPVTLFRTDCGYSALPSVELDDDEVDAIAEYDPFDGRPAH